MAHEEIDKIPEVLCQEDNVETLAQQEIIVTPKLMEQEGVVETHKLHFPEKMEDKARDH